MKRILSLLLCLTMCVSLFPADVFAEEEVTAIEDEITVEETSELSAPQLEDSIEVPDTPPDEPEVEILSDVVEDIEESVVEEEPIIETEPAPTEDPLCIIAPETELEVGETMQLTLSEDIDSSNVVWSSSDENVLTVDETGLVTAISEGNAEVCAEVEDNTYSIELCVCCDCCCEDEMSAEDEEIVSLPLSAFLSDGASSNVSRMGQEGLRMPSDAEIEEIVNTYWSAIGGSSGRYWNKYLYDILDDSVVAKDGKDPNFYNPLYAGYQKLYNDTINGNFANTVTNKKCLGKGYNNGCRSNCWYGVDCDAGSRGGKKWDSQCAGFASYIIFLVYGTCDDSLFIKIPATEVDNYVPKPGDLVRLKGTSAASHSIFIYKVVGDTVYYIEGNSDSYCLIGKGSNTKGAIIEKIKEWKTDDDGKIVQGYVRRLRNTDILETIETHVKIQSTSKHNIKKTPFDAGDNVRETYVGEQFVATKIVKNKNNNYWYYIPSVNGYVNADDCKYVGAASSQMITFNGTDISGSIKLTNNQYHLPGSVSQPGNVSVKLTAEIIPSGSSSATTSSSQTFSGSSMQLCSKSSTGTCSNNICLNLKFGALSSGVEYRYKLTASYTLYHCADNDDQTLLKKRNNRAEQRKPLFNRQRDTYTDTGHRIYI